MRFPSPLTVKDICNLITVGLDSLLSNISNIDDTIYPAILKNSEEVLNGISTIEHPKKNTLLYLSGIPNDINKIKNAGCIITTQEVKNEILTEIDHIPLILTTNPKLCMAALLYNFTNTKAISINEETVYYAAKDTVNISANVSIGVNCYIGENVSIGQNSIIHPHAYIGKNVKILDNTVIHPNVTILDNVRIGNGAILHSGCVIGGDGFGYAQVPDDDIINHIKLPHLGSVVIEDHVEIGCNTSIDRGFIDNTVIKEGTKIDNCVQVAHNVTIGRRCIIAGQVGVAGNSKLGDEVVLFGQVGIADNLSIGNHNILAAQSGVMNDIPDTKKFMWWAGTPAIQAYKNWKKVVLAQKQLPALVNALQKNDDFEKFKNQYLDNLKKQEKDNDK